ncbi:polysaccharide biosynthesis protein [Cytobacillus horneckiae]|uniref:polysaccharide biosynthesis protein n=1 Tax=Cytobacillus horneckiae TaxID=549687 RepID=UPI003D9A8956
MAYYHRFIKIALLDCLLVSLAVFTGNWMINPLGYGEVEASFILYTAAILLLCHYVFFSCFKLYKKVWTYASVNELLIILKATTLSMVITSFMLQYIKPGFYIRELIITWIFYITFIGGSRFFLRVIRDRGNQVTLEKKRTLIIGAGSAGTMLSRKLLKSTESELLPVAFADDDIAKQNLEIFNIPVVASTKKVKKIVEKYKIEHIIIAIPSLQRQELNAILDECSKTNIKTQIVPRLEEIVQGKKSINQINDVKVEDLLGRTSVQLDDEGILDEISGKTILITGAGGSIGSEICRQVTKYDPAKIVLLGHGENSIYTIEMELREKVGNKVEIATVIADIQDRIRIFEVIGQYRPHIVYHTAAHKHVPLMERNPKEAVKNNVLGTMNVAEAADVFGVKTFVMVSTDKAVNPTSVMGASKRLAEMLIQHRLLLSQTKFVTVRFGNVLGSKGSVIPLFKKQIEKGGPVTVTHPEMMRYFMTIPEASRLVIQASILAKGGEIFVLDMGEPIKIIDFAKKLIQLSGYSENEIEIIFTGIRPGEKLYEELLEDGEIFENQIHPKINIGKSKESNLEAIEGLIVTYERLNDVTLKEIMLDLANYRFKYKYLIKG